MLSTAASSSCAAGGGELFMKPLSSLDMLSTLEGYDDDDEEECRRAMSSWVTSLAVELLQAGRA